MLLFSWIGIYRHCASSWRAIISSSWDMIHSLLSFPFLHFFFFFLAACWETRECQSQKMDICKMRTQVLVHFAHSLAQRPAHSHGALLLFLLISCYTVQNKRIISTSNHSQVLGTGRYEPMEFPAIISKYWKNNLMTWISGELKYSNLV